MAARIEKKAIAELLRKLPEDTSLEEIQYSIYVQEVLRRRLDELPKTKLLSQREVERRMSKWLGK